MFSFFVSYFFIAGGLNEARLQWRN